jgi:MYXO-CTERM domain-containing protein
MQNFDCPAATPVCGFPSHQCQACATNDDCLDRGGVCATSASDPNKGRCVQCLASTDCISPATCTNDVCSGGSGLDDGGTNVPWDSGDPVVTAGSDAGGGGGDGGSAGDDGGTVVGNDAGAGNDGGGTVVPPGGGPDGGGPGAVDAGEGGGGSAGGCHCSAGRSGPSSEGIASALLLGVVGLVRRRRWKAQAR